MTNREKARRLLARMRLVNIRSEWAYERDLEDIESALDAERKAAELDGQIKALEWATDLADSRQSVHVGDIIARVAELRAEKAKLT